MMTWKQACRKSPHNMAVRTFLGGSRGPFGKVFVTRGGAVLSRHGDRNPYLFSGDLEAARILRGNDWEPLTGKDPACE